MDLMLVVKLRLARSDSLNRDGSAWPKRDGATAATS